MGPASRRPSGCRDFLQRVDPDHREPVLTELRRCHELGQDFDLELKIIWPDGTERWIYDRGRALRDHTGRPVLMTGACVDITERKLAEQDIRERERMLRAVTDNSPDIGMPGLDGHEVARRLRSIPKFSTTRLVALTGWGSEEDKALAAAAGFGFHLTKPVSVAALHLVLSEDPGQAAAGKPLAI